MTEEKESFTVPRLFDDKQRQYCFKHMKYTCRCYVMERLVYYESYRNEHPELESQFLDPIKEANNGVKLSI